MSPKWRNKFVHNDYQRPHLKPRQQSVLSIDSNGSADIHIAASQGVYSRHKRQVFRHPSLNCQVLRQRELGNLGAQNKLELDIYRGFAPWREWTGASKDVLSVSWGSHGYFAIGSSTDHEHDRDIPYNRRRNLILGNTNSNRLYDLNGHYVNRPLIAVDSERSKNSPDAELFMTVSHVTFDKSKPLLYSAGYDRTVRIWDISEAESCSTPTSQKVLRHEEVVDIIGQMINVSPNEPSLLATAQKSRDAAIKLFNVAYEPSTKLIEYAPSFSLQSERALRYNIYPSAMAWGPDPINRHLLLVGFAEINQNHLSDREGHVCLWDMSGNPEPVRLSSCDENVFDVAWAPGRKIIAAATTPRNATSLTHRKKTRTIVRTWSPFETSSRRMELECPALDINDVRFHHTIDHLITASCTDGRVYVWDARMEHEVLMALEHGEPVETLDAIRPREESDVGVRFTSWDSCGRYLYTGSSDGRVGCWNILLSPVDALVREVAHLDSGIMAGSFSPDGTKLLLGTVKGSVEVLSVGAAGPDEADVFTYIAPSELEGTFDEDITSKIPKGDATYDDGIRAARYLVTTGQIEINNEFGPGQGLNYNGPWNTEGRTAEAPRDSSPLLPSVAAQQFDAEIRHMGNLSGGVTLEKSKKARKLARAMHAERRAEIECSRQSHSRHVVTSHVEDYSNKRYEKLLESQGDSLGSQKVASTTASYTIPSYPASRTYDLGKSTGRAPHGSQCLKSNSYIPAPERTTDVSEPSSQTVMRDQVRFFDPMEPDAPPPPEWAAFGKRKIPEVREESFAERKIRQEDPPSTNNPAPLLRAAQVSNEQSRLDLHLPQDGKPALKTLGEPGTPSTPRKKIKVDRNSQGQSNSVFTPRTLGRCGFIVPPMFKDRGLDK